MLVNEPNKEGDTPLHCAARKGFVKIVDILLKVITDKANEETNNEKGRL